VRKITVVSCASYSRSVGCLKVPSHEILRLFLVGYRGGWPFKSWPLPLSRIEGKEWVPTCADTKTETIENDEAQAAGQLNIG